MAPPSLLCPAAWDQTSPPRILTIFSEHSTRPSTKNGAFRLNSNWTARVQLRSPILAITEYIFRPRTLRIYPATDWPVYRRVLTTLLSQMSTSTIPGQFPISMVQPSFTTGGQPTASNCRQAILGDTHSTRFRTAEYLP